MTKEDLLKLLMDAGLQNDEIIALLNDVLAELKPAEVEEPQEKKEIVEESNEEKENRIFGI